jgi:hypothetical protein
VIDVTVARLDGDTGSKEELAQQIGTVDIRLTGVRRMRLALAFMVVIRSRAFVVLPRVWTDAKVTTSPKRPNGTGVQYRHAI